MFKPSPEWPMARLISTSDLAFDGNLKTGADFVDLAAAYGIIMGSSSRTEASATGRSCEGESNYCYTSGFITCEQNAKQRSYDHHQSLDRVGRLGAQTDA